MKEFDYLLEKLDLSEKLHDPFTHIEIKDFFSKEHFKEIISSKEINISSSGDVDLFDKLRFAGWKPIEFPGATTEVTKYLKNRSGVQNKKLTMEDPVEGEGVVMRLYAKSEFLGRLDEFFASKRWLDLVARKFDIEVETIYDGGIQKYLDGYEISPHPDIRKKACTWMININPSDNSEMADIHTMYNSFKKEFNHIYEFWDKNKDIQRAWVPWNWVDVVKRQVSNNSIVLFSPHSKSLHSVKASYDHNLFQRTQIYGNLWYENDSSKKSTWHELEGRKSGTRLSVRSRKFLKNLFSSKSNLGKRNIE